MHLTPTAAEQLAVPFDRSNTAVQAWLKRRQPGDDKYTPHDCRRTASTLMNGNKVQPFIVERVLNHTMQGVMAVYNQAPYEEERIEAATAILGVAYVVS